MILTSISELAKVRVPVGTGLTSGCFDLNHFYHLHYLERCRAKCDFLVVGVDSDDLVWHFKKKRPVNPEYQRAAMIAQWRCVDAVFIMRRLQEFEEAAQSAEFIFKNELTLYGKPIIGVKRGTTVIQVPDVQELTSTTAIIRHIRRRKSQ